MTRNRAEWKVFSLLTLLALFSSAAGCGLGGERDIKVVMASGDMPQGIFTEGLDYTTYTLDELGKADLADEMVAIYDKYDDMAEGVTDRKELVLLLAKRDTELAGVVMRGQSIDQMMNYGVPVAVYRECMSELDRAFFPDKEAYLEHATRPR